MFMIFCVGNNYHPGMCMPYKNYNTIESWFGSYSSSNALLFGTFVFQHNPQHYNSAGWKQPTTKPNWQHVTKIPQSCVITALGKPTPNFARSSWNWLTRFSNSKPISFETKREFEKQRSSINVLKQPSGRWRKKYSTLLLIALYIRQ